MEKNLKIGLFVVIFDRWKKKAAIKINWDIWPQFTIYFYLILVSKKQLARS